jgi:hypothetical protein
MYDILSCHISHLRLAEVFYTYTWNSGNIPKRDALYVQAIGPQHACVDSIIQMMAVVSLGRLVMHCVIAVWLNMARHPRWPMRAHCMWAALS